MLGIIVMLAAAWAPTPQSPVEWPKTIVCPAGRVYRDTRQDAGRREFCALLLPGSLWVEDGPERWWFSLGHFGGEGSFEKGRKAGPWKECDRFGRCQDKNFERISAWEKARGARSEIPVSYVRGKYVFDFNSCWSTWVTRQTPESFLELNIGDTPDRCHVTYIPSTAIDRPAGSQGHYLCGVPHAVGVREFDSLDLRKELPRAGLPQFCGRDEPSATTPMPDGLPDQAFGLHFSERVRDARTGKDTQRPQTILANMVDVECAAIQPEPSGRERFTVRLNAFVEKLVRDRLGTGDMKADACGGRFPLALLGTTTDPAGRTLFAYGLSVNRTTAARQTACITAQIHLQSTCASR